MTGRGSIERKSRGHESMGDRFCKHQLTAFSMEPLSLPSCDPPNEGRAARQSPLEGQIDSRFQAGFGRGIKSKSALNPS